jgi:NADPH2:quinone reductase
MGLKGLGTAGTPKGLELAKREGAHQVFDHREAGYQEEILRAADNRGVDIILEMLANVNLSHDTKLLANNGRVIVIGSRGEVTINPRELMGRRASIRAFTLWGITPEEEADIHAGLFAGLENGTLRPIAKNCQSRRRLARTRKSLKPERPARSCLSADVKTYALLSPHSTYKGIIRVARAVATLRGIATEGLSITETGYCYV